MGSCRESQGYGEIIDRIASGLSCRACIDLRPPKHRFTQYLHGATSQKTAFFIVTAVKPPNLTEYQLFIHLELLSFAFVIPGNRCHFATDSVIPSHELHRFEMYLSLPRRLEVHWLRLGDLLLSHLLLSHHLHLQVAVGSLLGDFLGDPLACLVSQISD
jgi:hypothetical protein